MDNASKALRIAGAVLLGLMVTSLIVLAFNMWQSYQKKNLESIKNQQATEFNGSFDVYNKKALRGSDLVSLANKINSANRQIAGSSDYMNTYGLTNMNFRYEETEMMPIRVFVSFYVNEEPVRLPLIYNGDFRNSLPGYLTYSGVPETHQSWDSGSISTYVSSSYTTLFPQNVGPEYPAYFIDLDEYIQKIYNNDALVKKHKEDEKEEIRKVFKGLYFECIQVDFDSQTGKYCRMFFKQVAKINV